MLDSDSASHILGSAHWPRAEWYAWGNAIADRLEAAADGRRLGTVLDYGCGGGAFGAAWSARYPGCRLVGVDPNERAREAAWQHYDDMLPADALLPTVDAVVCVTVLQHLELDEALSALRRLAHVLRHGGVGVIQTRWGYDGAPVDAWEARRVWGAREAQREIENAGLRALLNEREHSPSYDWWTVTRG